MNLAGSVFEVTFVDHNGASLAIKRLREHLRDPSLPENAEALASLTREARFLELARHPAIPRLIEYGSDANGPFVVEERAPGTPLDTLLDANDGKLSFDVAARITLAITRAFTEIHTLRDDAGDLSLVHGDPSPANVIVAPDGAIRLVDFGASRFRGVAASIAPARGTLPYSAPELCRGEVGVSRETDVYATGAIATHLLTGEPLSSAQSEAAMLLAIGENGIDPTIILSSSLPPTLRDALMQLIALERSDRAPDCRALVAVLASDAG